MYEMFMCKQCRRQTMNQVTKLCAGCQEDSDIAAAEANSPSRELAFSTNAASAGHAWVSEMESLVPPVSAFVAGALWARRQK